MSFNPITNVLSVTGSINLSGPLTGTASFATSASRAVSSSFATTASYALNATAGSTAGLQSLQFSHGAWVTASATPVYYGNYPAAPITSINRIGVISPYTGTLVSASISGYMENPGGTKLLSLWVVRDGAGTPVSMSFGAHAVLDTDKYVDGFTYTLNPAALVPFTITYGDMLSIKLSANGTVNGLNAYTTVTLLFRP